MSILYPFQFFKILPFQLRSINGFHLFRYNNVNEWTLDQRFWPGVFNCLQQRLELNNVELEDAKEETSDKQMEINELKIKMDQMEASFKDKEAEIEKIS